MTSNECELKLDGNNKTTLVVIVVICFTVMFCSTFAYMYWIHEVNKKVELCKSESSIVDCKVRLN